MSKTKLNTKKERIVTALTITILKANDFITPMQTFKRRSTTTKPRLASYTLNGTLLGTKLNNFINKTKLIDVIRNFNSNKAEDFINAISKCLPQQVEKESRNSETNYSSKYQLVDFPEFGVKILFRISDHNINPDNIIEDVEETYSIALKSIKSSNTFKPNDLIVTEYVFFTENCDCNRYKRIAENLLSFAETSVWDNNYVPADKINISPKESLEGIKKADNEADFMLEIKISKTSLSQISDLQTTTGLSSGTQRATRAFRTISATATSLRGIVANIADIGDTIKIFENKINNWDNEPIESHFIFILYVLSKLPPKETSVSHSYYVVDEKDGNYRIRISSHNAKSINFLNKSGLYKVGITFKKKSESNSFESNANIFYKENVYYTENTTSDTLKEILKGIVKVLKGGLYDAPCDKMLFSPSKEKYEDKFGISNNPLGNEESNGTFSFALHLSKLYEKGEKLDWLKAKKIAKDFNISTETEIMQSCELAIVLESRRIAQNGNSIRQQYEELKDLYERQVNIKPLDTKSKVLQQYSTPCPLAYLLGTFIKGSSSRKERYFEPSAGNGMLTIALPEDKTCVNEIDEVRISNLKSQNFVSVWNFDSSDIKNLQKEEIGTYKGVITNPPFGKLERKEQISRNGWDINTLDYKMAIYALDTMLDNGRCAIIVGGKMWNAYWKPISSSNSDKEVLFGQFKTFLGYLYAQYNVVDVIYIDGENIYRKQGTQYPIVVILVDGRHEYNENNKPNYVFDKNRDKILTTFDQIFDRIFPYLENNDKNKEEEKRAKALFFKQKMQSVKLPSLE